MLKKWLQSPARSQTLTRADVFSKKDIKYIINILSVQNNLLMLAILVFEVTIYRHQEYFRVRNKLSPPAARIIFHDITRQHLDTGIINFIKYFINYFFYKFGLEVETCEKSSKCTFYVKNVHKC